MVVDRMWPAPGSAVVHVLDHAHEQLRGARRKNTKTAGRQSSRQALMPSSAIRSISARSSISPVPRSCSARGGGLERSPSSPSCSACGLVSRKEVLDSYDDYACRIRWRLIPLIGDIAHPHRRSANPELRWKASSSHAASINCYRSRIIASQTLRYAIVLRSTPPHSHSIVPGGLLVTLYTTRFTPFTSLMIRVATVPMNPMSNG